MTLRCVLCVVCVCAFQGLGKCHYAVVCVLWREHWVCASDVMASCVLVQVRFLRWDGTHGTAKLHSLLWRFA